MYFLTIHFFDIAFLFNPLIGSIDSGRLLVLICRLLRQYLRATLLLILTDIRLFAVIDIQLTLQCPNPLSVIWWNLLLGLPDAKF